MTLLCRFGFHARCHRGRNRPGTTNRCPYWEGWRAGYAWRHEHKDIRA